MFDNAVASAPVPRDKPVYFVVGPQDRPVMFASDNLFSVTQKPPTVSVTTPFRFNGQALNPAIFRLNSPDKPVVYSDKNCPVSHPLPDGRFVN